MFLGGVGFERKNPEPISNVICVTLYPPLSDEDETSHIRFATIEKIKQFGATARIREEI